MVLQQKEMEAIQDLQTQEQSCVEKYHRYKEQAKDPELKKLFETIEKEEQKHLDSLTKVLNGEEVQSDCNDSSGKNYEPVATYAGGEGKEEDKQNDCFLVTDCIGTEKLVSGEYNTNVFKFAADSVRKLLADIQIEEQNHAEMLYKYKMANSMA